uniref:Secreted protein n=1 Tax=Angiostrongylus cantonensis TaxID=6313 RepID=A0A0K0DHK0_ANGCA
MRLCVGMFSFMRIAFYESTLSNANNQVNGKYMGGGKESLLTNKLLRLLWETCKLPVSILSHHVLNPAKYTWVSSVKHGKMNERHSSDWPRRDDATHSTPSITSEKKCSLKDATVENFAASAFS